MEWIQTAIDFFLHIDRHLDEITRNYGLWTYLILFLVIFCETGLVVTPLLPGDSLLFAAGALAARPTTGLDPWWLCILLIAAAVLGDTVNYWIGNLLGPKWLKREKHPRFLKKEYLDRTHAFFERYGGTTIILCRFVPIVRTFAPFMAGMGQMNYGKFLCYNIIGGVVWVALFIWGGYWFGNFEVVQKHFGLVTLAIIIISLLPMVVEFVRYGRQKKAMPQPAETATK
jgi:membrane-associated protein